MASKKKLTAGQKNILGLIKNATGGRFLTIPEMILEWVKIQHNPKYVECVYEDLFNTATGRHEGNKFEKDAVAKIFELQSNQ